MPKYRPGQGKKPRGKSDNLLSRYCISYEVHFISIGRTQTVEITTFHAQLYMQNIRDRLKLEAPFALPRHALRS
jgi:hypothetical protein